MAFEDIIERASAEFEVDPELIRAVMVTESGGKPDAISAAGARGAMQLMPATAMELGVTDPFDPEQNIRGGAQYLRKQLDRFGNNALASAAYNMGPSALANHIELFGSDYSQWPEDQYTETLAYIPKVMKVYEASTGRPFVSADDAMDSVPPATAKLAADKSEFEGFWKVLDGDEDREAREDVARVSKSTPVPPRPTPAEAFRDPAEAFRLMDKMEDLGIGKRSEETIRFIYGPDVKISDVDWLQRVGIAWLGDTLEERRAAWRMGYPKGDYEENELLPDGIVMVRKNPSDDWAVLEPVGLGEWADIALGVFNPELWGDVADWAGVAAPIIGESLAFMLAPAGASVLLMAGILGLGAAGGVLARELHQYGLGTQRETPLEIVEKFVSEAALSAVGGVVGPALGRVATRVGEWSRRGGPGGGFFERLGIKLPSMGGFGAPTGAEWELHQAYRRLQKIYPRLGDLPAGIQTSNAVIKALYKQSGAVSAELQFIEKEIVDGLIKLVELRPSVAHAHQLIPRLEKMLREYQEAQIKSLKKMVKDGTTRMTPEMLGIFMDAVRQSWDDTSGVLVSNAYALARGMGEPTFDLTKRLGSDGKSLLEVVEEVGTPRRGARRPEAVVEEEELLLVDPSGAPLSGDATETLLQKPMNLEELEPKLNRIMQILREIDPNVPIRIPEELAPDGTQFPTVGGEIELSTATDQLRALQEALGDIVGSAKVSGARAAEKKAARVWKKINEVLDDAGAPAGIGAVAAREWRRAWKGAGKVARERFEQREKFITIELAKLGKTHPSAVARIITKVQDPDAISGMRTMATEPGEWDAIRDQVLLQLAVDAGPRLENLGAVFRSMDKDALEGLLTKTQLRNIQKVVDDVALLEKAGIRQALEREVKWEPLIRDLLQYSKETGSAKRKALWDLIDSSGGIEGETGTAIRGALWNAFLDTASKRASALGSEELTSTAVYSIAKRWERSGVMDFFTPEERAILHDLDLATSVLKFSRGDLGQSLVIASLASQVRGIDYLSMEGWKDLVGIIAGFFSAGLIFTRKRTRDLLVGRHVAEGRHKPRRMKTEPTPGGRAVAYLRPRKTKTGLKTGPDPGGRELWQLLGAVTSSLVSALMAEGGASAVDYLREARPSAATPRLPPPGYVLEKDRPREHVYGQSLVGDVKQLFRPEDTVSNPFR